MALRFPEIRTDLLALQGNALYWFDARTADAAEMYHRIERLNLATLEISTVFESKTPLMGYVPWTHGLIVSGYLPKHLEGCAPRCVQPAVTVVDFRRGHATPQVVARGDPQRLADAAAIALLQWQPGVLFGGMHHGTFVLQTWRWRTGKVATVRSDSVDAISFDTLGDVVVGQHEGSRGLWAASLTGGPAPQLPPSAAARGLYGTGQGSRLIWAEQPDGGTMDHAYASTLRHGKFGPPKKLFDSEIYVLQTVNRCLLVLRSPSGLFAINTCSAGISKSRLLTARQSSHIYNPGRFATRPDRFVFALSPSLTKGPETLVILRTPTAQ